MNISKSNIDIACTSRKEKPYNNKMLKESIFKNRFFSRESNYWSVWQSFPPHWLLFFLIIILLVLRELSHGSCSEVLFSHSEFTPSGKLLAGILVKNQPKVREEGWDQQRFQAYIDCSVWGKVARKITSKFWELGRKIPWNIALIYLLSHTPASFLWCSL